MTIERQNTSEVDRNSNDKSTLSTSVSLIANLLESENNENNNLIEILGIVKPSKKASAITSIIRGLFTKNAKLLSLLNTYLQELSNDETGVKEVFKNFVNEFILWIDNDSLILFEKYYHHLSNAEDDSIITLNLHSFGNPILSCLKYVEFIDSAIVLLRNPFVIDKLMATKNSFVQIIDNYHNYIELKKLNSISFNNIKAFGGNDSSSTDVEKVSSFFKVNHIVERSKNELLYIIENKIKTKCELVLLNLSGHPEVSYNSLAILSISNDDASTRSLIYPPFRVNELSIHFKNSKIILESIDFSAISKQDSQTIIEGPDPQALLEWFNKLSLIFPSKQNDTPVNESFLIQPQTGPKEMSGLGINLISDMDPKMVYEDEDLFDTPLSSSKSNTFKELISSPSLSSTSSISQLQHQFQQPPRINSININQALDDFEQPNIPNNDRKLSSSSAYSMDSRDSIRSQYNRSLNIINKTLSNTSLNKLSGNVDVFEPEKQFIKTINRSNFELSQNETEERHKSSQAEIAFTPEGSGKEVFESDELTGYEKMSSLSDNYQRKQKNKFSSVPDLSETKKSSSNIYHLSSGSEIDLSNFGKNYNPSFSLSENLSSITETVDGATSSEASNIKTDSKLKRKSIFNIFKKSSKSSLKPTSTSVTPTSMNTNNRSSSDGTKVQSLETNQPTGSLIPREDNTKPLIVKNEKKVSNTKGLTINTNLPLDDNDQLISSAVSEESGTTMQTSTLPSPFALPSSTSMNFFKQYRNSSSANLNSQNIGSHSYTQLADSEEVLDIPQDLKDIINEEPSIDFYISSSSPKSMKISKWKQKYGKWEMITINENLFVKIVVNYELNKGWLIIFKEEYDNESCEDVDKAILLLDINETTSIRQSSALDLQINSVNSITSEKLLIMIRCKSGSLLSSFLNSLHNVIGIFSSISKSNNFSSLNHSSFVSSNATISSSIMDHGKQSTSSAQTSVHSSLNDPKELNSTTKLNEIISKESPKISLNSEVVNNVSLNNPENRKLILLNSLTIRLQEQLVSYDQINNPSTWKITSMYSLSIFMITESFTNKNFYNLELKNNSDNEHPNFNWLISEDDKFNRIERIGKAGLLIKVDENQLFMIECKGKKEFKRLFDLF